MITFLQRKYLGRYDNSSLVLHLILKYVKPNVKHPLAILQTDDTIGLSESSTTYRGCFIGTPNFIRSKIQLDSLYIETTYGNGRETVARFSKNEYDKKYRNKNLEEVYNIVKTLQNAYIRAKDEGQDDFDSKFYQPLRTIENVLFLYKSELTDQQSQNIIKILAKIQSEFNVRKDASNTEEIDELLSVELEYLDRIEKY